MLAADALLLERLKIVFWDKVEFGVLEVMLIPIIDAVVVVPVPMLVVIFRTVFEKRTAGALLVNMPMTCDDVPVAFREIEFTAVPPTVFPDAVQVTVLPVKARIPMSKKVPEAPRLVADIPPTGLLFDVHAFEVKLCIPYTSVDEVVVVEKVSEPVADWLPIVLPLEMRFPSWSRIPVNGLDVVVPLPVTPVMLTDAMVLLLIFVVVPATIPLNRIPTNFAPVPAPVRA
jgi:hypothetical protein